MGPYCMATIWVLVAILAAALGQTEEDEKRPYKFAFAIEGYQHRSEEKDERGIIMGEFGFVTGDGVYHVTVYATDENGDFKILSMKNFYIGLPGEGTTVAPTKAPTRPPPPTTAKSAIQKHLDGLMGCGGCIVPDKTKGQSGGVGGLPTFKGAGDIDVRFGGSPGPSGSPRKPGITGSKPGITGSKPGITGSKPGITGSKPGITGSKPGYNEKPFGGKEKTPFGGDGKLTNAPKGSPQYNTPSLGPGSQYPQSPGKGVTEQSGNRFGQPPTSGVFPSVNGGPASPGQQGIQKSHQTGAPSGGIKKPSQTGSPQYSEGLPPGMTMEDLMALLYKFNYTLKYHGHHESGYRNGDKEGGYFFNGRDGLGRNVKYVANEFGFQPNITLVDLGLQSPDTPKETNEEPNELRGNEFKWFYKR